MVPPGDNPVSQGYERLASDSLRLEKQAQQVFEVASSMAWSGHQSPQRLPKDPSQSIPADQAISIGLRLEPIIKRWKRAEWGVWLRWLGPRLERRIGDWLERCVAQGQRWLDRLVRRG